MTARTKGRLIRPMTIRMRLIVAFILLLVLAVVEGMWSLSYVGVMHDRVEHMYKEQLLAIKVLGELRSGLYGIDRGLARLREAAAPDREEQANELKGQLSSMEKLAGEYRKSEFTAVEQKLVSSYQAAFGEYASRARAYLSSAVDGNQRGTVSRTTTDEPFHKAGARLADLIDFNKNSAQTHYEYAKVEYVRLRDLVVGIICAFFAAGAILAFLIIRSISRRLGVAVSVAERVARGDLSAKVDVGRKDEIGVLLSSMEKMIAGLIDIVRHVRMSTEKITRTTRDMADGSSDLSRRTEQQAASIEETAATIEELTSTSLRNTENSKFATGVVSESREQVSQSVQTAERLVECMTAIYGGAARIGEITTVIDEIAFQTNILALNAAVEAARAGEQGRGFVVVASEVRALAQHTAIQAKEIKELIRSSIGEVDTGKRYVVDVRGAIDEIAARIDRLHGMIGQIASASAEQTAGIEQINSAMSHMDGITQRNATLVGESASASAALNEQALRLSGLVQMFKLPSDEYKNEDPAPQTAVQAPRIAAAPNAVRVIPLARHAGARS